MATTPVSPWPQYPVPIYLDASDDQKTLNPQQDTKNSFQVPRAITHNLPIHYMTVSSSTPSISVSPTGPNNDSNGQSAQQFASNQSHLHTNRYLAPIEHPRNEMVYETRPARVHTGQKAYTSNQTLSTPYAASKPTVTTRSQVRYSSPSIFQHRENPTSGSGLGISNAPRRFPSTSTASPAGEELNNEPTPNLAQRIEKRLYGYSITGNVLQRWLLEIICWLLSAACMALIIGILIHYKEKKLPEWPGGLTLNTLISILSKIAGAALLLPTSEALGQLKWIWFQRDSKKMWDFEIFDNASRGPWGSLLLLIRTKFRTLAALGAAITILSLALDPFFQQVVNFPHRWTCNGQSSVPKVIRYEPRYPTQFKSGAVLAQQDPDTQYVAEKFFYSNGTDPVPFANGTRADIPLSCPTSNCTWPSYESLGVCSACADVSYLLNFTCLTTRVDWIANLTGAGTEKTYPNGTVCGYFLNVTSDSPVLVSGYNVNAVASAAGKAAAREALLMRALPLITTPGRNLLYGGSINFKHIRNPIVDVLIISAANGSESIFRHEAPVAQECVLSWCVQTIQSSYYWANYEEKIIKNYTNNTAGPSPWYTSPPTSEGTETLYLQNVTIEAPASGNITSDYGVNNVTAFRTCTTFDDIFPSFTTISNSSAQALMRFKVYQRTLYTRTLEVNPWLSPNNVTRHMERLATALTNVIRASNSKEMLTGNAYSEEVFVSVRWEWLILPLSILFLSLVFLVATILKSSSEKEQVGVWKTSAIATLLYGIPDEMQKKIASQSKGTPRAKAKELKVKIHPKRGWRISGPLTPRTPKVEPNQPPPGWI